VCIAARDPDGIGRAAQRIAGDTGANVVGIAADLSTSDAINRWHAEALKQFGGVDLLFANTGGPPTGTALSFDDHAWHAAVELLLMSVVRAVGVGVHSMRARAADAILISTASSVADTIAKLAPS